RSVRERQATPHHQLGQPDPVRLEAHRGSQGAVQEVRRLQDAGLSDPPQRRRPPERLRRYQAQCHHRQAGSGRQRRDGRDRRRAWVYNPGQRRVRRAPNVAFDNPGTNSDNLRTSDQFDMYNGSPERYEWKLVGKKEMYVPYNAYRLQDGKLKYGELLQKNHI